MLVNANHASSNWAQVIILLILTTYSLDYMY